MNESTEVEWQCRCMGEFANSLIVRVSGCFASIAGIARFPCVSDCHFAVVCGNRGVMEGTLAIAIGSVNASCADFAKLTE